MLRKFLAAISVMSFTMTIIGLSSHALALNITLSKASTNSVHCTVVATGAGNVTKDPLVFSCIVAPLEQSSSITGLVVCGNPGKKTNTSPGIQLAELTGSFSEFDPVSPKSCDKNGKCTQEVVAEPNGDQLTSLNAACPNPNWVAKDFVPCAATVTVQGIGLCSDKITEGVRAQATYSCVIPNCEAVLTYDPATQTLVGPDYTCTKVSESSQSC